MTPYEIKFILHCFTSPSPYEDSNVKDSTVLDFMSLGLIKPEEDYFICTEKGCAFVEMLMSLRLPKQVFVNPDTDKFINIPNSHINSANLEKE